MSATAEIDYAMELVLQRIAIELDNVGAHRELRELSLRRKAAGGNALGMFETLKLEAAKKSATDPFQRVLAAEKLLAYDPGNVRRMMGLVRETEEAGLPETTEWLKGIIRKTGGSDPFSR